MLQHVVARCANPEDLRSVDDTPIGLVPKPDAIDISGLNVTREQLIELLAVDKQAWAAEAKKYDAFLEGLHTRIPQGIKDELAELKKRTSNDM